MPTGESVERTVVLADGSDSLEDRLGSVLSAAGFSTRNVSSAASCLSRVEEGEVDGVVTAYELPDINGLQLLQSVRISHPHLPFFLAPRDGSETLAGDAVAAGVSGYVPRDSNPETTVARLERSVNRDGPWLGERSESQHRYRHLIEKSPAPINIFDENGDSIWCNRALLELFGFESQEEFIGRSIFEVIHPEDRERARDELETVIGSKISTGPTKMKLRTPDGTTKYIHVSTAIGTSIGSDIGQAVAIDVTDREERERQLQILDQWLQHNIRNEVTAINGFAENIKDAATGSIEEDATRIQNRAKRLVKQADHERSLTQILAPTATRKPISIDIDGLVSRQMAEFRERRPNAMISSAGETNLEIGALPEIETAISELLTNAVQHNDADDPTVRIEVEQSDSGDRCVFSIADNGPGIPEPEQNALVLDREIDELNHASGLGLVLVYWVVRLSGGTIEFSENEPRGSIVTVSLPRETASDDR